MESQNIEFRAVIKFLTKEGAKAKETHRSMADVYGDSSPKYSTVAKWSAEFKRGQDSLEDDPRPGRPADVISQEMIDRVQRCAKQSPNQCSMVPIKPEHARSSAKGGVKSRTSGSVQCQCRRLSHLSCNRR